MSVELNEYLERPEVETETLLYKRRLEAKIIEKFKKEFKEKIGYEPHVLTMIDERSDIPKVPILMLRDFVDGLMKEKFGNQIIGSDIARLANSGRHRDIVNYRFIYFKLARMMGNSFASIGQTIATSKTRRYDHTTVMYGCKSFDDLINTNEQFRDIYLDLVIKLKENFTRKDLVLN
jgi:chromosomal replication initiation ATPase DnaA